MPTPELIALARAAASNHALDFTFSVSSQEGLPGPRPGEPGKIVFTGTALVCAIVEQESAWDPHAMRYEPGFRTRYVAPLALPPKAGPPGRRLVEPGGTEEIARSISWGLMQVMGQSPASTASAENSSAPSAIPPSASTSAAPPSPPNGWKRGPSGPRKTPH